jgi:hypothetical protein
MLDITLFMIEVVSAIMCAILVRFVVMPFLVTMQSRYLGLPLGFGFLGASYAFTALSISGVIEFDYMWWAQLFLEHLPSCFFY